MTIDRTAPAGWTFAGFGDEFDSHVAAHLPGYADVQRLVALVASFVVPSGGLVADLGASTGTTAATILDTISRPVRLVLYDEDASMLDGARNRLPGAVETVLAHLPADPLTHEGADLTLLLWLLQFLPPADRRPLLSAARRRSRPSGAVLVAAKTRHADPRWEEVAVAALDDYKAEQGVTADERVTKTRALRGALTPSTSTEIAGDLIAAGWRSPVVLWRWHAWTVIGAWASDVKGP